jgi:hypothetical protein
VLLLQPERYEAAQYAELLGQIDRDAVRRRFDELTDGSSEVPVSASAEPATAQAGVAAPAEIAADSALSATSTGTAVLDGKGHLTVTSSGGDVLIQGGPFVKITP